MPDLDYYSLFGLPPSATDEEIKTLYRKLARDHHPDRGGDPVRFKEISEAYATLSDPTKRQSYDYARNNTRVSSLAEETDRLVEEYFKQFARS